VAQWSVRQSLIGELSLCQIHGLLGWRPSNGRLWLQTKVRERGLGLRLRLYDGSVRVAFGHHCNRSKDIAELSIRITILFKPRSLFKKTYCWHISRDWRRKLWSLPTVKYLHIKQ